MNTRDYEVSLSIDADSYRRLYSGQARVVVARDSRGRTVQFPADSLRPFVAHEGVYGTFVIQVDSNNRLVGIRRKAD